jgi:membrane protease YdiL (CAAX protease family)
MTIRLLRWSLSLVLGLPAVTLVASAHHAPLIAIGVTEAIGAALLQPRHTRRYGAGLLVLSLLAAAALHALSGESPPLAFLVYVAAIAVVATPC